MDHSPPTGVTTTVCPDCGTPNQLPAARVDRHAGCGRCGHPLFQGKLLPLDLATFDTHVVETDVPLAVVFWTGWNLPSRELFKAARHAAAVLEPGCRLAAVDVEEEQKLCARLGVRALPSLVVYARGEELARRWGPLREDELVAWLGDGARNR